MVLDFTFLRSTTYLTRLARNARQREITDKAMDLSPEEGQRSTLLTIESGRAAQDWSLPNRLLKRFIDQYATMTDAQALSKDCLKPWILCSAVFPPEVGHFPSAQPRSDT